MAARSLDFIFLKLKTHIKFVIIESAAWRLTVHRQSLISFRYATCMVKALKNRAARQNRAFVSSRTERKVHIALCAIRKVHWVEPPIK